MKLINLTHKMGILSVMLGFTLSVVGQTNKIKLEIENPTLPVLTKKSFNPTLKLNVIRLIFLAYTINEIEISLAGTTDINDVVSVSVYGADKNGLIDTSIVICKPLFAVKKLRFKDKLKVNKDTLSLWVSVKLKDKIGLSHQIQVNCEGIKTSEGSIKNLKDVNPLKTGVAVRQHKQDGVHTSRVPGLTTSKKGPLLAVFDARWDFSRDLQGNIDIGLHRSIDGGQTWQPLQIAIDMGEWGNLPQKFNGVSDACILVDDNTGELYIASLWMYGIWDGNTGKWVEGLTHESNKWQHQWQGKGSQPGLDVKQTSQFLIVKSTDDGLTWSHPINITSKTKKPEWWLYAPAPGHGITLKDGTLVLPTQGRDEVGKPFSNITWSKDKGHTWITSKPAYNDVTECMAVELNDGSIMLNMRDNCNRNNPVNNGRRICITSDLGQTWLEHPTSRKSLIEPTCMASIHRHKYTENGVGKSVSLFVNPNAIDKRNNITLKVSFDDGNTWPEEYWILLDQYSGAGYSCITSIDEGTTGVIYESSQANLVFQQIKLRTILKQ